jgi:hypothetical protein
VKPQIFNASLAYIFLQNFSHGGDKFLNFFSNEIVMIMEQKNKRIKEANMLSELSQL